MEVKRKLKEDMLADSSESSQESGKENSILAESKVSCRNIIQYDRDSLKFMQNHFETV